MTTISMPGIERIKKERVRQIVEENHKPEDDKGRAMELHRAGTAYLQYAMMQGVLNPEDLAEAPHPSDVSWVDGLSLWPWARGDWKPGTMIENITKGGALIAAALDHGSELNAKAAKGNSKAGVGHD